MNDNFKFLLLFLFTPLTVSAQFYTVTKERDFIPSRKDDKAEAVVNKVVDTVRVEKVIQRDTVYIMDGKPVAGDSAARVLNGSASRPLPEKAGKGKKSWKRILPPYGKEAVTGARRNPDRSGETPDLTIPNLYGEIVKAGILYPKVVLAQALLETGWFRSRLCREGHNLFGLTDPKTGRYFEFGHWTDSVLAYRDKVQYKYKGGNYLLWLGRIGYAEDPRYVSSVIRVLRML